MRAMIFVKDFPRLAEFYTRTLGLEPIEATRLDNWVEFNGRAAGFSLHAIPEEIARNIVASPKPRETGSVKVSFEVPDVEAECRRLEALGVQVLRRPWGGRDLVDPEGNVIGLYQVD